MIAPFTYVVGGRPLINKRIDDPTDQKDLFVEIRQRCWWSGDHGLLAPLFAPIKSEQSGNWSDRKKNNWGVFIFHFPADWIRRLVEHVRPDWITFGQVWATSHAQVAVATSAASFCVCFLRSNFLGHTHSRLDGQHLCCHRTAIYHGVNWGSVVHAHSRSKTPWRIMNKADTNTDWAPLELRVQWAIRCVFISAQWWTSHGRTFVGLRPHRRSGLSRKLSNKCIHPHIWRSTMDIWPRWHTENDLLTELPD